MITPLIDPAICGWAPTYFGIISDNVYGKFVYYSHGFSVFIGLIVAFYIFAHNRKSAPAQSLLFFVGMFSLWSISDLFLWASNRADLIMFFWSIILLLEYGVYVGAFYFFHSFMKGRLPGKWVDLVFLVGLIPIALLVPTHYNLVAFDFSNCDRLAIEGVLPKYIYGVEALIVAWLVIDGLRAIIRTPDAAVRRQWSILLFGVLCLLGAFSLGNITGSLTDNWEIGQWGLMGMPLFILLLGYMIVRYHAFNMKVVGAEALVFTLFILTSGQLFVRSTESARVLTMVSMFVVLIAGFILVRSVRKEVVLREEVEQLAGRLKSVNRIMSHDVKSVLNKDKMLMAALVDGSFGEVPDSAKSMLSRAEHETGNMLEAVMTILQSGQEFVLHKESYDMKEDVIDVVETLTPDARAKGLSLHVDFDYGQSVVFNADPLFMRVHVIKNLILNSILYTPTGSVTVRLAHTPQNTILFSVQDTGVGIALEDAPMLFKEGGHGAHSQEVNTHSTGYGLFSAKRIVDAHGGKIWFESEGIGKGTAFFVELPIS